MNCDHCGRDLEALEYTCRRCDGTFCTKCRLPESHDCIGLKVEKAERELKREEGEIEPWFKDDFDLSNVDTSHSSKRQQTHPADKEPQPTAECETCDKELRDHEVAACPYCGEVYCGEHVAAHRSKCFDPVTSADSSRESRSATRKSEADDEIEKVHQDKKQGEKLQEAAKEVKNKRYPNVDGSPDVAPDGSLNRDSLNADHNQQSKDGNTKRSRIANAFWTLIGVPIWLASSGVAFVKAAVRYPVNSFWKVTKLALVIGVVLLLAGQVGLGPVDLSADQVISPVEDTASSATEPTQLDEQEVEQLVREGINERRADQGLSRLSSSAGLQEQARLHSANMVEHDELAHDLPGSTTDGRLSLANCDFGGENVAQSWYQERVQTSSGEIYIGDEEDLAEALVTQWMNSPPHRENLLREEWSQTGVGIELTEDDKVYAAQKFCA